MTVSIIPSSTNHITDSHRLGRLYKVVDDFDSNPELAKRVYHLGIPQFTDAHTTAALSTAGGRVSFEFNRSFFDSLGQEELVFVLMHEALHYGLRHHQRCQERIHALWNIACDLVTNAILLHEFGFNKIATPSFINFLKNAITFENLPLIPQSRQLNVTAEEIYRLLEKGQKRLSRRSEVLQACDEHPWSESYRKGSPQEADLSNSIMQQAMEIFREFAGPCGHHALGEIRAFNKIDSSYRVEWDKILKFRIKSCINETTQQRWAPPNRRISWLYPEVLLPTDSVIENRSIGVLLALDCSGSISSHVLNQLVALAKSLPLEKVKLSMISFDTKAYPINLLGSTHHVYGGGGTSFEAVEGFARQAKQYPDLIVVLTDGEAPRPKVRFPEKWFWLITADGMTQNIENIGRYCRIHNSSCMKNC